MSDGASPMTVVGLSGSLRKKSFNTSLLKAAVSLAPKGMTIETGAYADFPLYNQDLRDTNVPAAVSALTERIRRADAVLIVSPEYNYSIPGGLKNAIDWISRMDKQPFDGKLVAIMGASQGRIGTARMQYHLRQSFVFLNSIVLNRPEVMVGNADKMFDDAGKLTDEETRKIVTDLLKALAASIGERRGIGRAAA